MKLSEVKLAAKPLMRRGAILKRREMTTEALMPRRR
jgi:hypothetical protein